MNPKPGRHPRSELIHDCRRSGSAVTHFGRSGHADTGSPVAVDHDIETHTEIAVSPEDDVELRRVHITNSSLTRRTFDVTSYTETVFALSATDAADPAFSKLFVETEILRERQAILCTRRPRAPDEPTPWIFHLLDAPKPARGEVSYETDRMRFIGRGRTPADPHALDDNVALSGSAGPVLDSVAAIRCRITVDPGEPAIIDLISDISEEAR